jgi:hypothetical protein
MATGTGSAGGMGSMSGNGTGSGMNAGSGSMTISQTAIVNQLVIANFQQLFAQQVMPPVAFALIVSLADVNGDGFADVTALIGLKVGSGKNAKTEIFKVVFDGTSTTGATIGSPQILGTF